MFFIGKHQTIHGGCAYSSTQYQFPATYAKHLPSFLLPARAMGTAA
jgi:hypothetical protein